MLSTAPPALNVAGDSLDAVPAAAHPKPIPCPGNPNFAEITSAFIHPTMVPFITTLRVGEGDDDVLYFNIPNGNHNEFTRATARDVMNNILNNYNQKEDGKYPRSFNRDISLVMLHTETKENVRNMDQRLTIRSSSRKFL